MAEARLLPVPEGLVGERVDVALSRLLGLSRTRAGELASDGHVLVDGQACSKSQRLGAGDLLQVEIPEDRPAATPVTAQLPVQKPAENDSCKKVVITRPGMTVTTIACG